MRAAFYTATRPGAAGWYNRLVRWWDSADCSHVELVFADGMSASSSLEDGGVRFKRIEYNPAHWEVIDLGNRFDEAAARAWFEEHAGTKYDLIGQLHFIVAPVKGAPRRYWCSEACAAALKLREPWRYSPYGLKLALLEILQPAERGFFYTQTQG